MVLVLITIVTGANLNQLTTGGPHIVGTSNQSDPEMAIDGGESGGLAMKAILFYRDSAEGWKGWKKSLAAERS